MTEHIETVQIHNLELVNRDEDRNGIADRERLIISSSTNNSFYFFMWV